MYKWQTKIHLGKQNGNNFNWRIWYNNKYHINNSSNNKSPLPRRLQPLPRFLGRTEQLLWYFLWIDLSNIRFRFDFVKKKEGTRGQTVLKVLAEFFEAGLVTVSRVWGPRIKLYYFWLGSHVLLTESNLSDQYFVDWLRCHTMVPPTLRAATCRLMALGYFGTLFL